MSTVTDQFTSIASKLRKRLTIVAESELSDEDRDYVIDILVMRTALLHDLTIGSTQAVKAITSWTRTILGLKTLNVELYAGDWKLLRQVLTSFEFRVLDFQDTEACRRGFKHLVNGRIHYKWILNSALQLIEGEDWFADLNQWIVFDSKVNLTSLDLSCKCCLEYLDFESTVYQRLDWFKVLHGIGDPFDTDLDQGSRWLYLAKRSAEEMFGDFDITDYPFRPKHGNGATLEVKRQIADTWHKNRYFKIDSDIVQYVKYRTQSSDWRQWFYSPYKGLDRTSELVCVPKSMVANRTISKEPTTLQYLQQDVFQALDDYFLTHLGDRIDLHDQCRSRALAKAGSADGSFATIDLSSASDSVTTELVEYLFGDLKLGYPLRATRSTYVHVSSNDGTIDETIVSSKFAPMGSACCFPVECAVFAVLCETAVRALTGRKSDWNTYRVYGDDIVIKDEFAPLLIKILQFFGFLVNRDKSFYGEVPLAELLGESTKVHIFREACGIECLDGVDITPLRLSRRLTSISHYEMIKGRKVYPCDHQAGLGVGMVDLVNRSFLYGFYELRRLINSELTVHKWYRTLLRVSQENYEKFVSQILEGGVSEVRIAMPFVITPNACDTQWRAFKASGGLSDRYQTTRVLVTCVKGRRGRIPAVRGRDVQLPVHLPSGRLGWYHDENDYFSWCLAQVTMDSRDVEFDIDDTRMVTIRSRDLKWSQTWVVVDSMAHLSSTLVK